MATVVERWSRDKTDYLQLAFFNGVGWESWENLWGIWNGLTPRDAEAARRMATLERALAPYLTSPAWEPFYPMAQYGVFASRWPGDHGTAWTIVNRNEYAVDGREMTVPYREGMHYFDLYHGREVRGERRGTGWSWRLRSSRTASAPSWRPPRPWMRRSSAGWGRWRR